MSGAICGIAGMVQACGTEHTLSTSVAGGVGFTAIIVAWLANLNPFGILVVSFLFAVLERAALWYRLNLFFHLTARTFCRE